MEGMLFGSAGIPMGSSLCRCSSFFPSWLELLFTTRELLF